MISVRQIMTPRNELITLSPDADISDAARLMAENGIRHIPVVSDERLIGMISHRDVLASGGAGTEASPKAVSRPLEDVMSAPVHAVEPETGVRQTALRLQKLKIGCLAVMSGSKLEGIVTDSDFVGVAINLLEQLEAVEPLEQE